MRSLMRMSARAVFASEFPGILLLLDVTVIDPRW